MTRYFIRKFQVRNIHLIKEYEKSDGAFQRIHC